MDNDRLVSGIVLLLIVALLAPFAAFAVPEVVGAEASFVVLSGSMAPTVAAGDVVVVDDEDPAAIGTGEIITYKRSGDSLPTTHRVVAVQEQNDERVFVTKGDANEERDPQPVAAENVVGTVTFRLPWIGYVIQFANTALGQVVFLLVPFFLLGLSEIRALVDRLYGEGDGDEPSPDDGPPALGDGRATRADDESPVAEGPRATVAALAPGGDDDSIRLDPTDLTATSVVLVLAVPYVLYTAVRLQSQLTISVAFASLFLLLAIGSLRVAAERAPDADTAAEAVPALPPADGIDPPADDELPTVDDTEEIRFPEGLDPAPDSPTATAVLGPDVESDRSRTATDGGPEEVN